MRQGAATTPQPASAVAAKINAIKSLDMRWWFQLIRFIMRATEPRLKQTALRGTDDLVFTLTVRRAR
jgi:hypothetical protein